MILLTLTPKFKNGKFFQFSLSLVAVRLRPMKTRFHKFVILWPFVLTPTSITALFFILLKGYVLQAYPITHLFLFIGFSPACHYERSAQSQGLTPFGQWLRPRKAQAPARSKALSKSLTSGPADHFRLRLAGRNQPTQAGVT